MGSTCKAAANDKAVIIGNADIVPIRAPCYVHHLSARPAICQIQTFCKGCHATCCVHMKLSCSSGGTPYAGVCPWADKGFKPQGGLPLVGHLFPPCFIPVLLRPDYDGARCIACNELAVGVTPGCARQGCRMLEKQLWPLQLLLTRLILKIPAALLNAQHLQ